MKVYRLLSQTDRHPKMLKNSKVGIVTAIMHLSPADRSGYEVCPMRSPGCTDACLNTAGKQWPGRNDKQAARIRRTVMFFEKRQDFMMKLHNEIRCLRNSASKAGAICGVRLNGTSDIPWETVKFRTDYFQIEKNIMGHFPDVEFYDYTKRWNRKDLPKNYRLVFSKSENNLLKCITAIRNGMNVAVVFKVRKGEPLPARWHIGQHDMRVIDGDEHDWRYGDYDEYPGERVIVGLRAKGKGLHDQSGFVVDPNGQN